MAGGNGFEPLLDAPEASVLPLDEPPISRAGSILSCQPKTGKLIITLCNNYPGCKFPLVLANYFFTNVVVDGTMLVNDI